MLLSCALILFFGMVAGEICKKLKLPALVGMLVVGMLLGPYIFNLLDESILSISSEIRKMALIIILTRAGLKLNIYDLKKVGRPAFLMCFLPACFEILGCVIFAPKLLGMSTIDSLILGSVIAAVSPAVVVPAMVKLIENKRGTNKRIPQLILAGASVDDVVVIALFSAFIALAQSGSFSWQKIAYVPVSIFLGILFGILVGFFFSVVFKNLKLNSIMKVILVFSITLFMVSLEEVFNYSSLIGVMSMAMTLFIKDEKSSKEISMYYDKLWSFGEIFLFVLVGASVNLPYAFKMGIGAFILILCCLFVRMIGVYLCLLKSELTFKERMFTMIAYTPKATVQAAIGGIPLSMGLGCGEIVLSVAVLSILITAPIGAFMIEKSSYRLLENNRQ